MALEHTLDTPLAKAVVAAGSQSAFARVIKRSQPYVYGLMRDGKELHPREAKLVDEAKLGLKHELCPDSFDPPRGAAPADPAGFEHAR